jgi:hypothetical protein
MREWEDSHYKMTRAILLKGEIIMQAFMSNPD